MSATSQPRIPKRFLGALDAAASVEFDPATEGWILSIGGAEQSHVDLTDPTRVFYEYLRRIANVMDLVSAPGRPIRTVHLGGGALTLPRYIAATRPGSIQVVVELARELPDFVTTHLPLPRGAQLEFVIADARAAREELATKTTPFDVVVLDVFAGANAPQHLRERSFYQELKELLAPGGVLVVNVGDDPGLRFFAEQANALGGAGRPGQPPVFPDVWCLTEQSMLRGSNTGNLVLLAGDHIPRDWQDQLMMQGPHPGAVLNRWELEDWLQTL